MRAAPRRRRPGRADAEDDLRLLRRFEPVVRYTRGEMFFPMAVEGYVERCSLWRRRSGGMELVVPAGELSLERLTAVAEADGSAALSLRFVQEPLGAAAYRRWRTTRPEFSAQGRLARAGLAGRLADAAFYLSFLLRGTVPGGTVARGEQQYAEVRSASPGPVYYGRVQRESGYTVLNYQFFYAMNDWRSSFLGVNDHEADWEQVFVYLAEDAQGCLQPVWLAYACHDYWGDDLRRRWDDPDVSFVEGHPVVYAGAGSHASYFKPGEYVAQADLRPLRPLRAVSQALRRFWRDTLGQGEPERLMKGVDDLVEFPFVDYARGDGLGVGPGQEAGWAACLMAEDDGWVEAYRGLWGLDTQDVFAGEMAPAGPKYTREGGVRRSWYDPLGWAGLDKVPAPGRLEEHLEQQLAELEVERRRVLAEEAMAGERLRRLWLSVEALGEQRHLREALAERRRELAGLESERRRLTVRMVELDDDLDACRRLLDATRRGERGDARAHLRRSHEPADPAQLRHNRVAEVWAALSVGLAILAGVALIWLGAEWSHALILLVGATMLVDAILRGRLPGLLVSVTIGLALLTGAVLVYEFFWQATIVGLALIGAVLLVRNLRELREL